MKRENKKSGIVDELAGTLDVDTRLPSMAPPNPPPVIPAALKKLLPGSLDAQHVSIRVRTDKKMNSLIKVALASLRVRPSRSQPDSCDSFDLTLFRAGTATG